MKWFIAEMIVGARGRVFSFESAKAMILLDTWLQNKGFLWQTEHRRFVYGDSEGVRIISDEEAMARLLQAREDGAVITEAGQRFITAHLDMIEDA